MKLITNNLSKLVFSIAILLIFTSCEKDFGDINKSWDAKVYNPTIPALYNSIASSIVEPNGTGNIVTGWIYQNSQLAANYATSGYRMDNFAALYWNNYYGALANYRKLDEMINASPDAAKMVNVRAMARTLMAYKALTNTMIYGDMPYTDGGKSFEGAQYFRPKYDSQNDIVNNALEELKWAITNLAPSASQVSLGSSETIFGGDVTKWIKFANSLRLRYALTIHGKNATLANTVIAEALTKPLLEPSEVLGLYPGKILNYLNDRGPWYRGNSYVRMGSVMYNAMASNSDKTDGSNIYDLRCKIFFEPNRKGNWVPFPQAASNTTITEIGNSVPNDPYDESRLKEHDVAGNYLYSPLNFYYIADKTMPQLLITGSEISLLKAEIYNRGIGGVGADQSKAKVFYDEGITESIKFWYKLANSSTIWVVNKPSAEPSASELSTMLSNPEVVYSNTPATGLSQIYKQQWISLFHQPFEAWTLARRTGFATPNTTLASSNHGFNINRIIYPQSEIDGNNINWKAITGGTDSPNIKPWFMK